MTISVDASGVAYDFLAPLPYAHQRPAALEVVSNELNSVGAGFHPIVIMLSKAKEMYHERSREAQSVIEERGSGDASQGWS